MKGIFNLILFLLSLVGLGAAASSKRKKEVKKIDTVWIPMPDGVNLSATIWLPDDAERTPYQPCSSLYRIGAGTLQQLEMRYTILTLRVRGMQQFVATSEVMVILKACSTTNTQNKNWTMAITVWNGWPSNRGVVVTSGLVDN